MNAYGHAAALANYGLPTTSLLSQAYQVTLFEQIGFAAVGMGLEIGVGELAGADFLPDAAFDLGLDFLGFDLDLDLFQDDLGSGLDLDLLEWDFGSGRVFDPRRSGSALSRAGSRAGIYISAMCLSL